MGAREGWPPSAAAARARGLGVGSEALEASRSMQIFVALTKRLDPTGKTIRMGDPAFHYPQAPELQSSLREKLYLCQVEEGVPLSGAEPEPE